MGSWCRNVEKIKILTEEQATLKAKALCLKLLTCPEKVTILEMVRLQELIENEDYLEKSNIIYFSFNSHVYSK